VTTQKELWRAAYDAIQAKVAKDIKDEVRVRYSAFKSDANGIPIDNLGEIAVKGNVTVLDDTDMFFAFCENPTWLDLAVLANGMLNKTDDDHHVFFENYEIIQERSEITKDNTIIRFMMGS